jgi:hypothetical protein
MKDQEMYLHGDHTVLWVTMPGAGNGRFFKTKKTLRINRWWCSTRWFGDFKVLFGIMLLQGLKFLLYFRHHHSHACRTGRQDTRTTVFPTVEPNICGFSYRTIHVSPFWGIEFWCGF